jgi:hypothetical protein
MSERPQELDRLRILGATTTLTHEEIFRMRRELLGRGVRSGEADRLLAESARIVTVRLPGLVSPLNRLGSTWEEQCLLDPDSAAVTAKNIAAESAAIEVRSGSLVDRLDEIAARMCRLLGP